MQRIDFEIFDELGKQINEVVQKYGFRSRAEFFRYAAIDFIRRESDRIPADATLKEHARAIVRIKNNQGDNLA